MPELAAAADDPARDAEHREALEHGVTVLLERLAPSERAAYVLHEGFDYPYPQVARILETSEANARQLGSRARRHLVTGRRRRVSGSDHRRLVGAFISAARHGAVDDLAGVLTDTAIVLKGDAADAVM